MITTVARSRSLTTRTALLVAALLLIAGVLAGCTDDNDGGDAASKTTTTFRAAALAVDCPTGGTTTSVLPERCLNAAYIATINAKDVPEAVRKLGEDKQLAFAQGICAFAHVVTSGAAPAPVFQRFLDETAKSWKQPKAVVESIYRNASVLCPADYLAIANLPKTAGGTIEVALAVTGQGKATVTYTVPDGSSTQEQIAAPWTKLLQLETPIAVKVDVRPDESQALGCTIAVNDESAGSSKQVAEALGKEGELTTCEADTTAIDEANAGN